MLGRGLRLAWRQRRDAFAALAFFLFVAGLFPLVLLPDAGAREAMAPGVCWIAALLAALLAGQRLFTEDAANGVLEQVLLSASPWGAVGGMLAAQALVVALPLLAALPVVALFFGLDSAAAFRLATSILLGTPALTLLCALGSALTLGARGGGLLLGVVVLPWALPLVLFGVRAAQADAAGPWSAGALWLLAAADLACAALVPLAVTAALRAALE